MPLYEYKCSKCGNKFTLRRELSESEKEAKCPECGTEDLKRIYSEFGTSCQSCEPAKPWFARGGG
jgi:putative FmdB family regulatory protein